MFLVLRTNVHQPHFASVNHGSKLLTWSWRRHQPQCYFNRVRACTKLYQPYHAIRRLGMFTSFRVLELVTDSVDPERVGLSRHRMTRLLAPWTQEVGTP